MGLNPKHLPDAMLRRMTTTTRKQLGTVTSDEAQAKLDAKSERELHRQSEALFRQRDLFLVTSRMDRRTTQRKGMPDYFVVFPGFTVLALELKHGKGVLSDAQRAVFSEYEKSSKMPVEIANNLSEVKCILDAYDEIAKNRFTYGL